MRNHNNNKSNNISKIKYHLPTVYIHITFREKHTIYKTIKIPKLLFLSIKPKLIPNNWKKIHIVKHTLILKNKKDHPPKYTNHSSKKIHIKNK